MDLKKKLFKKHIHDSKFQKILWATLEMQALLPQKLQFDSWVGNSNDKYLANWPYFCFCIRDVVPSCQVPSCQVGSKPALFMLVRSNQKDRPSRPPGWPWLLPGSLRDSKERAFAPIEVHAMRGEEPPARAPPRDLRPAT